jgi:hypothetical protein
VPSRLGSSNLENTPRRDFARRAAAKILANDENRCSCKLRVVEREVWLRCAIGSETELVEENFLQAISSTTADSLVGCGRHKGIGIDVNGRILLPAHLRPPNCAVSFQHLQPNAVMLAVIVSN